jgi:Ca-activated chloride channel homolog
MKFIWAVFLVINPITYITDINRIQKDAQDLFQKKDYLLATYQYQDLMENYGVADLAVPLNTAHAYFYLKDAEKSAFYYHQLTENKLVPAHYQSIAFNQLAYIAFMDNNQELALTLLKQAIFKNPQNHEARYNFELLKKIAHKNPKNAQSSDNPVVNPSIDSTQTKKLQQQTPDKNGLEKAKQHDLNAEKEEKNQFNLNLQPEKLKDLKINSEKADAILDALRNQEIQYIQQLKRNKKNSGLYDKNKPDW